MRSASSSAGMITEMRTGVRRQGEHGGRGLANRARTPHRDFRAGRDHPRPHSCGTALAPGLPGSPCRRPRAYLTRVKPNNEDAPLPFDSRPLRVLLISGSQRRQYNCPGVDSKSRALMLRMADRLPAEWEIDVEDLGNVYARERIQSCNACASTSMALCCWPCN